MAGYNNERRRAGRGTYSGPERRSGRDRRGAKGRRGYDRNGDDHEGYYYGSQKKQQNPAVYFGIAGGVVLLIIIIIVATGSSSSGKRRKSNNNNGGDVRQMEARAKELEMQGGRAMQSAEAAFEESGQAAADPYYQEAYDHFQQSHNLYEELDKRYPNSRFYGSLQDIERVMYEVQKKIGTSANR